MSQLVLLDTNMAFSFCYLESCFDVSFQDFSLFPPSQAVNIAKWSEDVSGASIPVSDFICSSPELEMNGAEGLELKHDTASVYSMDSAYQSQSGASRSGATLPDGYQTFSPQDTRSRMSSQFLGSDVYSPTLDTGNYTSFPDQQPEMTPMQLPLAANPESGDQSFAYANYTTGQDFSQYTATSVPRFTPSSGVDLSYSWGNTDNQTFNMSFDYSPAMYPSQNASEIPFQASSTYQRQAVSRPQVNTSVRPVASRKTSSFMRNQNEPRRQSNEPSYGGFMMSPASAAETHMPSSTPMGMRQQNTQEATADNEATLTSLADSVVDDDELLSPSDAAAAQNIEDEQGKVARSHPLYQAQPDESGKYHCPNEGKPGCTHKPTPLKCNYDKYVDSHLKPFRCHKKICVGVQFSSTACLLRHEREAHGMHGHGSRPHLCHFSDCERSVPGNGFPRRYNLFDHMKRVHDFTGPTTENSPPSQASRKGAGRKRKSAADDGEKRAKVAKLTAQQQLQQRRTQLQDAFLSKKQAIVDILSNLDGPSALGDDLQLTKEITSLHELSMEYKKTIGG